MNLIMIFIVYAVSLVTFQQLRALDDVSGSEPTGCKMGALLDPDICYSVIFCSVFKRLPGLYISKLTPCILTDMTCRQIDR